MSKQTVAPQPCPSVEQAGEQMMKLITGKWLAKPITLAVELGLSQALAQGPLTLEQLAHRTGCHAPSLGRILRALICLGIFQQLEDGMFELTPRAEMLSEPALESAALMFNAPWNDLAWSHLSQAVRTGRNAFKLAHGQPLARWLADNQEACDLLSRANADRAKQIGRAVAVEYDFSGLHSLTDLGGGSGIMVAAILKAHPHLTGLLIDLPQVIESARQTLDREGLTHRCRVEAGDFLKQAPPDSEVILLANVLHDWPDEAALKILDNCRRALRPGQKLVVVEMLIPPGNEMSVAKFLDLEMMVITGGLERTEEEFSALFTESGFEIATVTPTPAGVAVIEATAS